MAAESNDSISCVDGSIVTVHSNAIHLCHKSSAVATAHERANKIGQAPTSPTATLHEPTIALGDLTGRIPTNYLAKHSHR